MQQMSPSFQGRVDKDVEWNRYLEQGNRYITLPGQMENGNSSQLKRARCLKQKAILPDISNNSHQNDSAKTPF